MADVEKKYTYSIDGTVYGMKDGIVTIIKIGEQFYELQPSIKIKKDDNGGKKTDHRKNIYRGGRRPAIITFVESLEPGKTFTSVDFFNIFPSLFNKRDGFDNGISSLIKKGIILQLGNDKFKKVKKQDGG